MYMKYDKGVKVYTLPAEEDALNELLNDPNYDILERTSNPCPKEGIILYLVRYEKIF